MNELNLSDRPDWFKSNSWLVQNQKTSFVLRLSNVIHQLQADRGIKKPDDEPMDATRGCFMGEIAVEGTLFQYKHMIIELNKLTGDDALRAKEAMESFENDFKDYLPFLRQVK